MEHYYSERQGSPLNIKKMAQKIRNCDFEFYTSSGIFSKKKIDKGTMVLAENMIIKENSKVLDIGCGIGVLGIVAAKLLNASVMMGDINSRAVSLAKKNSKLNRIKAEVIQGNLYDNISEKGFDVVLSNPPQNAGKEICFKIIEDSLHHLKKGGNLQLVARHNKGGKTLGGKMMEVFGNLEVIAKKSGYWVYMSVNK